MIKRGLLFPESRLELTKLGWAGSAALRLAGRVNTFVLLDNDMCYAAVAKVLLLENEAVRTTHRQYEEEGVAGLVNYGYGGSSCRLNTGQGEVLDRRDNAADRLTGWRLDLESVRCRGSRSGLIALLHRQIMEYRKPQVMRRELNHQRIFGL